MSEDIYEYILKTGSNIKINKTNAKHILKMHNANGVTSDNITYKTKSKDGYIQIYNVDGFSTLCIENTLKFLMEKLKLEFAYCKVYFEQTNERSYYTLSDGKLLAFESEVACVRYLNPQNKDESALTFFDQANSDKSLLLVRLEFHRKADLDKFFAVFWPYYNSKSDADYDLYRNSNLSTRSDFNEHFSHCSSCEKNWAETKETGFSAIFRKTSAKKNDENLDDKFKRFFSSCVYMKVESKCIYVGYEFDNTVGIEVPDKSEYYGHSSNCCSYIDVNNKNGMVICCLVESLNYFGIVKKLGAKFHSKIKGQSGQFHSLVDGIYYSPFFDSPNLPVEYWG